MNCNFISMNLIPINYNLTFEPDLEKFRFKGKEILTFELKPHSAKTSRGEVKQIVLDAVDLKIVNCQLLMAKKNIVNSFKLVAKEEKLIISLSRGVKQGSYELRIEFEGILNDKLAGFYRSKYIVDGKEKYLATTQFEATDARRAFPCIDDPSYKATFDVTVVIDRRLTAISNTLPIESKKNNEKTVLKPSLTSGVKDAVSTMQNKKKIIKFDRTPLMSTYLLYLGVGEFEFLEEKYKKTLIRIATTPGKSVYGKFALGCAKKSLDFFEKYFDYLYPLKKLDLIAIPDFATGAMENWGAITFRENALLFYSGKSSKATMQRIAEVVAHEIAHQWFGNLVTMNWWDDLWLNESFATYMGNKVVDHYWPEWKVWDQFVTDTVFGGMALDSLKSSHPIKVKVKNTAELEELFDEIAYEKGGSILRMLDLYLGEVVFREGLRNYIKYFIYRNAEAKDLWNCLEKVSDKPVVEIMQKFIKQVGFPKISVREKNNVLFFQQRRFLFEGKDEKSVWKIPLVLRNGKDIMRQIYLPEKKLTLRFNPKEKLATINHNYSGFYVSDYSSVLLKSMAQSSRFYSDSDKIGLIHDLFALILAGEKNLEELFYLINTFFSQENSSIVLHYIIAKLTGIYLLLRDERSKKFATQFSKRVLDRIVGYEPKASENILETFLRVAALSSLTLFNDNEVAFFVNKKFISYLEDEKSLHSDLRSIVYSSAIWFDDRNYKVLKKSYEESIIQEEKAKLLTAMGFSKNRDRIKETLEYIMSPKVPFAFLPYAVSSASRNPYAKEDSLDWLIKSWPRLIKSSGGLANMLLRKILKSIVPVCGVGYEKEIEKFLRENKISGLERTIDQTLEELRINSRFAHRYKINIPSMSQV